MLLFLLACGGDEPQDTDPKDTQAAVDTADSGGDTGADSGGDTGETAETGETADTVDTAETGDSCATPYYVDDDGDHWGTTEAGTACDLPAGMSWYTGDCDDADDQIHPSTDELCNGIDDDCDGTIDVGAVDAKALYTDADADGWGDVATLACAGAGYSDVTGDCDDTDATINPAGADTCDDGIDQDCTGADARCSFGGDLDYTAADASWEGDSAYWLGFNLSTVGDVDGDGEGDLLIVGQSSSGSGGGGSTTYLGSFVYGGGVTGGRTGSKAMSFVTLSGASGRFPMDGDLDADGVDDLVSFGPGTTDYSAMLLHWGDTTHPGSWAALSVDNYVDGTLTDYAGNQGSVGDADGDGVDDVLFSRATGVALMYGEAGARADSWIADWPSIEGSGGYFGGGGLALADFDGDGLDDVAFADVYMDMAGSDYPGGAYVALSPGRMTGTLDAYTDTDAVVHGPAGSGNVMAGYELVAGDLDGDGYAELVIGSHMYNGAKGADWIFSGPSLAGDLAITAATSSFEPVSAGAASVGLDLVADLDGDGGRELFVGATGSSQAWVFASGDVAGTFDETAASVTLTGPSGSVFGYHLAHGDLDADGLIDLVVSGYAYNSYQGGVWFFSGTSF